MRSALRDLFGLSTTLAIALTAIGCASDDASPSTMEPLNNAAGTGGSAEADSGTPLPPDDGPFTSLDDRPCPDGELGELTYESFGAPFFLSYCQGCHGSARPEGERQGAPPAVAFDDVAAIRLHAPRIWARAADQNTTMPPVGGPPLHEREKLGAWLACGARARAEL